MQERTYSIDWHPKLTDREKAEAAAGAYLIGRTPLDWSRSPKFLLNTMEWDEVSKTVSHDEVDVSFTLAEVEARAAADLHFAHVLETYRTQRRYEKALAAFRTVGAVFGLQGFVLAETVGSGAVTLKLLDRRDTVADWPTDRDIIDALNGPVSAALVEAYLAHQRRRRAYPALVEQVEALQQGGAARAALDATIAKIKARNPIPDVPGIDVSVNYKGETSAVKRKAPEATP